MRRCFTLIALLAAGSVRAADAPKPNTLTPDAIQRGYIQLFDGATTFGWLLNGPATVRDGVLVLGGGEQTTAVTTTRFGPGDWVLDFVYEGKAGQQYAWVAFGPDEDRVSGTGPGQFSARASGSAGLAPATPFRIVVPAGAKLEIRSLKLRPSGLEAIFNGKDLTGWKRFTGNERQAKSEFTVTPEGWIHLKNGPGDLQTEKQWADFLFQGDCISNGKALNSGVFFRCLPGKYQQGYEYQIQNGYKDNDRTKPADYGTGAIYNRVKARKVVPNDHEWFTMTLIANGNHISTWVNGYQTVDWTDTRPPNDNARNGCKLGAGPISLQGHDKTTDLSFRNLRIAELRTTK